MELVYTRIAIFHVICFTHFIRDSYKNVGTAVEERLKTVFAFILFFAFNSHSLKISVLSSDGLNGFKILRLREIPPYPVYFQFQVTPIHIVSLFILGILRQPLVNVDEMNFIITMFTYISNGETQGSIFAIFVCLWTYIVTHPLPLCHPSVLTYN